MYEEKVAIRSIELSLISLSLVYIKKGQTHCMRLPPLWGLREGLMYATLPPYPPASREAVKIINQLTTQFSSVPIVSPLTYSHIEHCHNAIDINFIWGFQMHYQTQQTSACEWAG